MSKQLIIRDSIAIYADPSRVWDALVNPSQTKKYMFGCETLSDWKTDSPLLWVTNVDGAQKTIVKGNIVEIVRNRFLAFTMLDPHAGIEDVPENYLTITYELSLENDQTLLTITQGDFSMIENGVKRYNEAINEGGWTPILVQIKKLMEPGSEDN